MALTLSPIFQSRMVLQQGLPIRVTGTSNPGDQVRVTFGKLGSNTRADGAGNWTAELPATDASHEPRELTISNGVETVSLVDVLVGEVWVCSGQSNMEWPLCMSDDADLEIASANFPEIRLFTVAQRISLKPRTDLPNAEWLRCDPRTADSFSAVGYFFGRELHRRLKVPVGLVHSSWGGTPAEAWVSRDGLLNQPELTALHTALNPDPVQLHKLTQDYQQKAARQALETSDAEDPSLSRDWASADCAFDEQMDLPCSWQQAGLKFNGIVWFKRSVELPTTWAGKAIELGIGAADKGEITYFNGTRVGSVTMKDRSDSWRYRRVYTVPAGIAKSGTNTIAVRVHSDKYDAGLTGPASAMFLKCPEDAASPPVALAGPWQYRVEKNFGNVPQLQIPPGSEEDPNGPTVLFNAMIHPLLPLRVRGAIWYQGESNVVRHKEYQILLPTLIRNWREKWGQEHFAFHIVQLANWLKRLDQPADSDWARLREAQVMALALPDTGLAVAVDIGDADDIHPRNKKDVGLRLAHSALHRTYGMKQVVPSGPAFREWRVEGSVARVLFDYVADGLVCRGESPAGFAIAGADRQFHWALAKVDGDAITLSHPAVPNPQAVRYAWADNPQTNLYNSAGLPAVPFRTDRW